MFNNQMMALLSELVILFPAFLLVFTIRGFFKAWSAKLMGDNTAYDLGFVTLNPFAHINFSGLLIMLFIIFFLGSLFLGHFARPLLFIVFILLGARWSIHVPINDDNFSNYTLGVIVTTLSGFIGSLLLALLFIYIITYFPYKFFPQYVYISLIEIFKLIIDFAIFFGVLDLIPIPPFDGGRLLQFIFPKRIHFVIEWLEEYSFYIILALFFLPGISNIFFRTLYWASFYVKTFLLMLLF